MISNSMDVVDVMCVLEKKFPHVELEVVDEMEDYRFRIVGLSKCFFNLPVKTTIKISKECYITKADFRNILIAMEESFGRKKLLGLN